MPTEPVSAVRAVGVAADRGGRIVAVLIAAAWHLAISLPAVLLNWSALRVPWLVGGGWLVYVAVGVFAGRRLLRSAELPVWPLIGVLLLVEAVTFPASGEQFLYHSANWGWGSLGWFALVVLWGRRITELIWVLAASSLIALVAVLGYGGTGAAHLSRYTMYVYGVAVLPVALAAGNNTLVALARKRAGTADARARVAAERAAAEQARRERAARLALASNAAEEVLRELAGGRADPTDPGVQRRSVLAAARLRRLIAESDDVPDPLLHELRASVDLAERDGLPIDLVTLGTPPPLPVEIRRQLLDPLATALADARDWARLTVVADPGEVVLSLVFPASAEPVPDPGRQVVPGHVAAAEDGPVRYVFERDEELVWVQSQWRAT